MLYQKKRHRKKIPRFLFIFIYWTPQEVNHPQEHNISIPLVCSKSWMKDEWSIHTTSWYTRERGYPLAQFTSFPFHANHGIYIYRWFTYISGSFGLDSWLSGASFLDVHSPVTKQDIEDHFNSHGSGKITEIKLMTGFGFIEYEDAMDAKDVVPGEKFSRLIYISICRSKRFPRIVFFSQCFVCFQNLLAMLTHYV